MFTGIAIMLAGVCMFGLAAIILLRERKITEGVGWGLTALVVFGVLSLISGAQTIDKSVNADTKTEIISE